MSYYFQKTSVGIVFFIFLCFVRAEAQNYCFKVSCIDQKDTVTVSDSAFLNIPLYQFDSIVINRLSIPLDIDCQSQCHFCSASLYYNYHLFPGNKVISKKIRGFQREFDSILYSQNKILFNTILEYGKIDTEKEYLFIVPIRLESGTFNRDSILFEGIYVFKVSALFNDLKLFRNDTVKIPANINECISQLDSIFSPETKVSIKLMSESCFLDKCWDLSRHLLSLWNLNCGFSSNLPDWNDNDLARYFKMQGNIDACFIPTIVLRCYYRYLKGYDAGPDEIIKEYREK